MCHYCTLRVIIPSWLLFAVISGVLIFFSVAICIPVVFCVLIIWLPICFPLYSILSMPVSQNVFLVFSWCHTYPDCSFPVFLNSFSYPLLICREPLSWTTRAYYHASTPCSFFLPLNADSGNRTHVLCLQGNPFTGLNFLGFLSF